jgi:hypothetical protein
VRAALALGLLVLPIAAGAQTRGIEAGAQGSGWSEAQVAPPGFPKPDNYLPLQVTATTTFAFFVDAESVSVGKDGVVRYSMIAKSAEGVLNISFEGIRCSTREYRVYAYGRPDNTWSETRSATWQPIPPDMRNAQRAVLYVDYFCPARGIIRTAEDGVRALRRGPPQFAQ